jgi:hypothetical protein
MSTMRNEDLSTRLLMLLHDRLPATLQPWSQAMLAELAVIGGFWPRIQWSLGGAIALLTAWLHSGLHAQTGEERRLDVSLIAGYQFLFSAMLIGLLTWQLPQITEPRKYAVPALIMCYAVAALPSVLGLGLMLRDEAARVGTIVFSIAHLLLNIEYIRRGIAPHAELTAVRIAVDLLIILVLSRRRVRLDFQLSPLALHLNCKDS